MSKSTITMPPQIYRALLSCYSHIGGQSCNKTLLPFIFGQRKETGTYIFDIMSQWESLVIAARAFCSIQNPQDVVVLSSKPFGKKAVQRFCEYTGSTPHTGRFIPGSFTNGEMNFIREPRLIIISDPVMDKNPKNEASKVNVPTIAFCNSDNQIDLVDCVIPFNNRSLNSIGAGFCILSKIINYMKGVDDLCYNLNVEIERYFYRNVAELEELAAEKEEEKKKEAKMYEEEKAAIAG